MLLNISVKNHEKIFCYKEFSRDMFICQKSEGLHPYLLKCYRGTCLFVGMLKGYMVRNRLGTSALKLPASIELLIVILLNISVHNCHFIPSYKHLVVICDLVSGR